MGIKYDEKSCGIILFRQEDSERLFLILHYPGGHYDFPKGHVEVGESELQTAQRELMEETGIDIVEFIPGYREEMSYKYTRAGRLSNKQVVYFLARTNTSEIVLSHEHKGSVWLPYSAALDKLTFENARSLLRKALAHLG